MVHRLNSITFDGKISGYEYRKLIKKKDEEVWKMLRREVHLENEDTEENVADIDEKEVETTKNNEAASEKDNKHLLVQKEPPNLITPTIPNW